MAAEQDAAPLFQSATEQLEPITVKVKGSLPSWLKGTLIRIGPGKFECGETPLKHLFDGLGLLHRFNIEDGHVTYSNKFVRSQSYADSLKHGHVYHLQVGTSIPPDPCQNIFARFFTRFWASTVPFDNTLVNVFKMKEKMYATTETNFLFEVNPETLETLNQLNFEKEFPGEVTINSATAHPHKAPNGSLYNITVTHGYKPTYNLIHVPPSSGGPDEKPLQGGEVLCSIPPFSRTGYFHSFCLTERFVVITEIPLLLNVWKVLTYRVFNYSILDWLYWDPNQQVRFHVINKSNGKHVGVFTAEPFLVFHHVNAFEENGKILLDACCYNDSSILDQLYLCNLRSPLDPDQVRFCVSEVRRYEIPLEGLGDLEQGKPLTKGSNGLDYTLLYSGLELPRINYAECNGKSYSFVYGLSSDKPQIVLNNLVKLNVKTKEFLIWKEAGAYPSEPVFVKAPEGMGEDDGVILSCVINVRDQSTSLVILDAKDFKELGRAVICGITPMTFHGLFE